MFAAGILFLLALAAVRPASAAGAEPAKLEEMLEELILKSSPLGPMDGFASYYARRFEGRKTTSGHRYHPDKLTAAHESLPLGTLVRVVNPATSQEVHVTITDRCARKSFNFIDLSRAAAKKIGLWGKGRIRVVIIPLLQEKLEKPS
jgi:rare lipoprotein A